MKKKLLISILVLLVAGISIFSFTACSQTASLTSIFAGYNFWNTTSIPEDLEYTMLDKNGDEIGTYKTNATYMQSDVKYYIGYNNVTTSPIEDYYFTFSSKSKNLFCIKSELKVGDSYVKTTETYFHSDFLLIASCTYINDNGEETFIAATNTDNDRYRYKIITNDRKHLSSNNIKNGKYISSPYFDNTMTFIIARAMPNNEKYTSFKYNVFDTKIHDKISVNVSNNFTSTEDIEVISGKKYGCKKVSFSTTDDLLGKTNSIDVYVAKDRMEDGKSNVICKIVEGNFTYILK